MNKIIRMDNYRPSGSKEGKFLNRGMKISSRLDLQEVSAEDTDDFLQDGGKRTMDESVKMMLNRLDQDAREREERYHKDAQEREQRYRAEMLEQDRRFRQEAKEREERILNAIGRTENKIDSVEQGLQKKIDSVQEEMRLIRSEMAANVKHTQSLVTTNFWGFIATIVAIVALVFTVIYTR